MNHLQIVNRILDGDYEGADKAWEESTFEIVEAWITVSEFAQAKLLLESITDTTSSRYVELLKQIHTGMQNA